MDFEFCLSVVDLGDLDTDLTRALINTTDAIDIRRLKSCPRYEEDPWHSHMCRGFSRVAGSVMFWCKPRQADPQVVIAWASVRQHVLTMDAWPDTVLRDRGSSWRLVWWSTTASAIIHAVNARAKFLKGWWVK